MEVRIACYECYILILLTGSIKRKWHNGLRKDQSETLLPLSSSSFIHTYSNYIINHNSKNKIKINKATVALYHDKLYISLEKSA